MQRNAAAQAFLCKPKKTLRTVPVTQQECRCVFYFSATPHRRRLGYGAVCFVAYFLHVAGVETALNECRYLCQTQQVVERVYTAVRVVRSFLMTSVMEV